MYTQPNVGALISKAIKAQHVRLHHTSRQSRAQGAAMVQAFGLVASDVLGLTIAPGGFELAVAEAVRESPMPPTPGSANHAFNMSQWMVDVALLVRRKIEENGGSFDPTQARW